MIANDDKPLPQPKPNLEVATTRDGVDITRGYTGPLLVPADRVLRSRGNYDLQIYEQVLSEPQVMSTFQQRRNAVAKCEWVVEAASERRVDKKAADFVREQLHKVGWDRITTGMLFGVFYGYAAAEIIYGRDGSLVTWEAIKVRNRRRFRFDNDMQLRLLTYDNMLEGIPARAPYFWHFATGADNDDEPYGLGLAHWCYWPTLFKRNGLKFWLIFLEKFGMPTAVGTYGVAASSEERTRLLAATQAIQSDSGIIIPEGMALSLLEAARSGTADYKSLHDTMDETIAKVVIGQTLTQGVGENGGSRALGNVHKDVRQDLVKADSDLVCESFNLGPVRWLCQWNFPDAALPRVYRQIEEPEDLNTRAERDSKIATFGFKPTLAYVMETYGGEWEEKEVPDALEDPNAPPSAKPPAEFASAEDIAQYKENYAKARLARQRARRDPAGIEATGDQTDAITAALTDLTETEADPVVGQWVGSVRELLEHSESLTDFRDRMLTLFADLPTEKLTQLTRAALMSGSLAGRALAQADSAKA